MNTHLFRFLGHYLATAFLSPPDSVAPPPASSPDADGGDDSGYSTPDWSSEDFSSPVAGAPDSSPSGGSDDDFGVPVSATPPGAPPVSQARLPASPVPPAVPQPPATPPAPAPSVPTAVEQQPPVQPQPTQPTPPNPLEDPEFEATTLRNLAAGYGLSPEQAERLQTEPENVLPELAGRLHYNMALANAAMIDQHMAQFRTHVLPGLIREAIQQDRVQTTVAQGVERDVFTPYPELRSIPKDTLRSMAQAFDVMMPGKSGAEKLQALVTSVYSSRGLPVPTSLPAPAGSQPPAAPQPQPTRPWTPVNPHAAPPPAPPGTPDNPRAQAEQYWAEFNE